MGFQLGWVSMAERRGGKRVRFSTLGSQTQRKVLDLDFAERFPLRRLASSLCEDLASSPFVLQTSATATKTTGLLIPSPPPSTSCEPSHQNLAFLPISIILRTQPPICFPTNPQPKFPDKQTEKGRGRRRP